MNLSIDDYHRLHEGKFIIPLQYKIDLNLFLTLLKPLQHRAYSITSSYNVYPKKVHLTVSTQRWKKNLRDYNGVCSTFLADKCFKGTKIKIFLISFSLFTSLKTEFLKVFNQIF